MLGKTSSNLNPVECRPRLLTPQPHDQNLTRQSLQSFVPKRKIVHLEVLLRQKTLRKTGEQPRTHESQQQISEKAAKPSENIKIREKCKNLTNGPCLSLFASPTPTPKPSSTLLDSLPAALDSPRLLARLLVYSSSWTPSPLDSPRLSPCSARLSSTLLDSPRLSSSPRGSR